MRFGSRETTGPGSSGSSWPRTRSPAGRTLDNLPAVTSVPLGEGSVQVPLEKVDGALSIAVVVDF
ncbi:MAG: hypothetical protein WEG36_13325 [Gemmatimonadota bacterium]